MARIMYIEDEQYLMQGVPLTLEEEGYIVDLARNSDEALEYLEKDNKPDLIILDVMLPQGKRLKDNQDGRTMGLTFLKYLKAQRYDIPTIVYTVVDNPKIEDALRDAGAVNVVNKEKSIFDLIDSISELNL